MVAELHDDALRHERDAGGSQAGGQWDPEHDKGAPSQLPLISCSSRVLLSVLRVGGDKVGSLLPCFMPGPCSVPKQEEGAGYASITIASSPCCPLSHWSQLKVPDQKMGRSMPRKAAGSGRDWACSLNPEPPSPQHPLPVCLALPEVSHRDPRESSRVLSPVWLGQTT